jgi:hypothetical protein
MYDFLVLVGDPSSPDIVFDCDFETLHENITNLVEKDEADPSAITVWRRTSVEVKPKACSIQGLDAIRPVAGWSPDTDAPGWRPDMPVHGKKRGKSKR